MVIYHDAYRVYEVSVRAVCHSDASVSVHSPFKIAQMLAAAVVAPAIAK